MARSGSATARTHSIVARAALIALLGAGAWLAIASATGDSIVDTSSAAEPGWLHGPFGGVLPPLDGLSFSVLLLVMGCAYAGAVVCADALSERAALGAAFGLVVLFGVAPVVMSSDLFGYLGYARLDVVHHLNPYTHGASAAPRDPIFQFVGWADTPSVYGPLYTLVSLPAATVSVPVAVWSLKSVSTVSCLMSLALIARAAPLYGRSAGTAVLLVGANPLLLAYGVGGGHNDLVAMAAVSAALLLLARDRRPTGGGAMLLVAAGVKASGGLLLPFAFVASRARRRVAAGVLVTGLAVGVLAVLAFGVHLFGALRQIGANSDFWMDYSGPDALGRALGTGLTNGVRLACEAVGGVIALVCLWHARLGKDWLAAAALAGTAILAAIPSLVPWYVAWVLPAAALARSRAARTALVLMTAAIVLTHLPVLGFDAF